MMDVMIETAAKTMFAAQFARYGELKEFNWDREGKGLRLLLKPQGETADLEIKIVRYRVEKDGVRVFLIAEKVDSSRPWVQALLEDLVQGQRMELPASLSMVAALL